MHALSSVCNLLALHKHLPSSSETFNSDCDNYMKHYKVICECDITRMCVNFICSVVSSFF